MRTLRRWRFRYCGIRILLNFHAESERIDSDEILTRLIAHVPPPKES